jgi:hypothetical protein
VSEQAFYGQVRAFARNLPCREPVAHSQRDLPNPGLAFPCSYLYYETINPSFVSIYQARKTDAEAYDD